MMPRTGRPGDDQALTLFAFLWAAATLFHVASYSQWTQSDVVVIAAIAVLLRPTSTIALALLAATQIYKGIAASPFIPNHWLFMVIANAGILLAAAIGVVWRRDWPIDRARLYRTSAPAIRVALLILYFFVVFHKLNVDFFDRSVSCGTHFYAAQLSRLPFLPHTTATEYAAMVTAIGAEALIPILLLFRRTRTAGIFVGFAFHWILTLNPLDQFYNFTSMLFAVFALFAPPALLGASIDRIGERRLLLAAVALIAGFAVSAVTGISPGVSTIGFDPPFVLWNIYSLALLALLIRGLVGSDRTQSRPSEAFRVRPALMLTVPAVVVLNGIMPYVGLKTEVSWSMFSNLRTEGDRSNHFIVPASVQFFDFQRDLVRIASSTDSGLERVAAQGGSIPYFELRRKPDASVTYIQDGVEHQFAPIADDPRFPGRPSWLMRKFMRFRPVPAGPKQPCEH